MSNAKTTTKAGQPETSDDRPGLTLVPPSARRRPWGVLDVPLTRIIRRNGETVSISTKAPWWKQLAAEVILRADVTDSFDREFARGLLEQERISTGQLMELREIIDWVRADEERAAAGEPMPPREGEA